MKHKKLFGLISSISCLVIIALAFCSVGAATRIDDTGGGGYTGYQYKIGYDYPPGTTNFAAIRVNAYLKDGWFVSSNDWDVVSDLASFSYDDYNLTGTTWVNSHYRGYGSNYGSNVVWVERVVSVYF